MKEKEKEVRILILGLDNAGKTTILYNMRLGEVQRDFKTTDGFLFFNINLVSPKNF